MPATQLLTYRTEAAEPAPSLGEAVVLRPRTAGGALEAFSAAGRRLGRLPADESAALAALLAHGVALVGRVSALVPRPGRSGIGRIHIMLTAA